MIGGLGGGLAGLGAVVGGANAGTAQAADALTRLFQARQAQQDLQQQQQWQQYAGPIWQGLQQQVTGGQQAAGQDIAGAQANYQPGAVQGYPLSPQVPNISPTFPQVPNFGGSMPATSAAFGTGQAPSYVDGVGPGMKSGQMPWSQFAPIMQRDESGGRNVPNYRFDPGHTASGVNQITDTTWNRYAPKVGAPQLSYPTSPMDRPVPEQNRVGEAIYNKEGAGPWANYNPALARDIQTKTQRIGQIASPEVAQGTQDIAHTALQTIDPATYGRQQLAATMQAIEQAAPDAPGAVKFMALGMISKILQPADQMALRLQMQQNQEALRLGIQQLAFQQQDKRQAAQFEQQSKMQGERDTAAEQRQTEREAAAERRTQEVIAGAGTRQERGIEAKKDAQPVGSVDNVAEMIAHYQMAPLSGWTMRGPWGQAVMAKVRELNPDYQATEFGARMSGARAFASGRQADTVRSMSVAIDHLGTAEDLGKALQNNDVRLINAVKNRMAQEFGYEGPVDFNTAKMIVTDEVTKAVAGGVLSMTERVALGDQLSQASSPEQLSGVITTLKRLLSGQLGGLRRQYEAATGKGAEDFDKLLSPTAKEQIGQGSGAAPAAGQQQKGAVPVPAANASDPDGTTYNGGAYVKRGNQMVPNK